MLTWVGSRWSWELTIIAGPQRESSRGCCRTSTERQGVAHTCGSRLRAWQRQYWDFLPRCNCIAHLDLCETLAWETSCEKSAQHLGELAQAFQTAITRDFCGKGRAGGLQKNKSRDSGVHKNRQNSMWFVAAIPAYDQLFQKRIHQRATFEVMQAHSKCKCFHFTNRVFAVECRSAQIGPFVKYKSGVVSCFWYIYVMQGVSEAKESPNACAETQCHLQHATQSAIFFALYHKHCFANLSGCFNSLHVLQQGVWYSLRQQIVLQHCNYHWQHIEAYYGITQTCIAIWGLRILILQELSGCSSYGWDLPDKHLPSSCMSGSACLRHAILITRQFSKPPCNTAVLCAKNSLNFGIIGSWDEGRHIPWECAWILLEFQGQIMRHVIVSTNCWSTSHQE